MNDEMLLAVADVFERKHKDYLQMPKFLGHKGH